MLALAELPVGWLCIEASEDLEMGGTYVSRVWGHYYCLAARSTQNPRLNKVNVTGDASSSDRFWLAVVAAKVYSSLSPAGIVKMEERMAALRRSPPPRRSLVFHAHTATLFLACTVEGRRAAHTLGNGR